MTPREVPWRKLRHHWEIYLFIVPVLATIGLFQYYPAASGIFHSFFRWNGFDISEFNFLIPQAEAAGEIPSGLGAVFSAAYWRNIDWDTAGGNYRDLVANSEFWNSFRVAFLLGAFNVLKMIPALAVAVCIHRASSARMQFLYRILFVVPMVIPGLVTVLLWRSFFFEATAGYLNRFLFGTGLIHVVSWLDVHLGLGGAFAPDPLTGQIGTPAWLGDPRLILAACILWGMPWVGSFAVLAHLAKLGGIDRHIYEAAEIDGVNAWSKFRHVELPLIGGSIYILLVFVIIETIRDAGMVIALAGFEGGPGGVVTVPALFMLRKAFIEQRMGYACAVGIVLTAVVMGLQKITTLWMGRADAPWGRWVFVQAVLTGLGGALLFSERLAFLGPVFIYLAFPKRLTIAVLAAGWVAWHWGIYTEALGTVTRRWTAGDPLWLRAVPWGFVVSLVSLAACFPYRALGDLLLRIDAIRLPLERRAQAREVHRLEKARNRPIRLTPRERLQRRAGRMAKHLTVWFVLAFAFLPVYLMIIVSVKTNRQFYAQPATITQPLHFENWAEAWDRVGPSVANSVYISTCGTALVLLLALCGAYFFARVKAPGSALFWNAILLLMMMPTIANLVPLFRLLSTLNLLNTLSALILVMASAGQISAIFILRNFIGDVPQDLFEAAEIDGASHFRQMWTIVVPLSGPILGTVGVMQFITMWNEFVLPLIIMRDHSRLPVMVQLLRMNGEYIKLWGPLMAGYAFASIPVIILFIFSMRLFVRGLTEGAVKN